MSLGTALAAPECPTLDFCVKEQASNWSQCPQSSLLVAARCNLTLVMVADSAATPGSRFFKYETTTFRSA